MLSEYRHMNWVLGYSTRYATEYAGTYCAEYSLNELAERDYLDRAEVQDFLEEAGLVDFHWSITWPEDFETPDELLLERIADTHGYALFVHGWTGNKYIWEDLPSRTVHKDRSLVALSVDHNGFGKSQFVDATPSLNDCNPPAAMRTLQKWVDLIKIRRQPGHARTKVINFIGHSMGGATLFYLNPILWNYGEVTRFALAPALLLEDETHQTFYSTLGFGIGLLHRLPQLEIFERLLKPSVLATLAGGASNEVKEMHSIQYSETPRGITGATLMAMGRLRDTEIARDFALMRVMLGHRDPLVGLVDMMDLLGDLEFPAAHIHVVPGTHYMFSVGSETPTNTYLHAQAREMVVEDIVALHRDALNMQRVGRWIG